MPEWYTGNMIVVCATVGIVPVVRTFEFADLAWSFAQEMSSAGCAVSVIIGMRYQYVTSASASK